MGRAIWQIRSKNMPYGERVVIDMLLLTLPASSKSGARLGSRKLPSKFIYFQNFYLKALDTESILKVVAKKQKKTKTKKEKCAFFKFL